VITWTFPLGTVDDFAIYAGTQYPNAKSQSERQVVVPLFETQPLAAHRALEQGRAEIENQYARSVRNEGNVTAPDLMAKVFTFVDRRWRGLDTLPKSAMGLSDRYAAYDAIRRFGLTQVPVIEPVECRAGEVLRGLLKPPQCPAFGRTCTPDRPIGAPMVSSEGACAAYFRAGRLAAATSEAK
jgi:hydrogenase expression/formation protein HypD